MKLQEAQILSGMIVNRLEPLCERIAVAGSIRRNHPEPNDVDIVLIPKENCMDKIKNICLSDLGKAENILDEGNRKPKWGPRMASFWIRETQVDLYFAGDKTWATLLLIRTGSKEHNVKLCTIAKDKGMILAADGSGLYADRLRERLIPIFREEEAFQHLGLAPVEPRLRG